MSKPKPGGQRSDPELENRARATMVALEAQEPEALRNIKALNKDPEFRPDLFTQEVIDVLYDTGMRPARRTKFVRESAKYLFGHQYMTDSELNNVLANLGPRMRVMVDWLVGAWEEYYRPKTWMDSLDPGQQNEWAVARKEYNHAIDSLNNSLRKARLEYEKEVGRVMMAQAVERERLKSLLRDFGVQDAPLLRERDAENDLSSLRAELEAAGSTFRAPVADNRL